MTSETIPGRAARVIEVLAVLSCLLMSTLPAEASRPDPAPVFQLKNIDVGPLSQPGKQRSRPFRLHLDTLSFKWAEELAHYPPYAFALRWTPDNAAAYQIDPEGIHSYQLQINLGQAVAKAGGARAPGIDFNRLGRGELIKEYVPDAQLLTSSRVGNDRFLHGRPYISALGLYDHRARFYDPNTLHFIQPDPLGPVDSPNLYQAFGFDAFNVTDPFGLADDWNYSMGGPKDPMVIGARQAAAREVARKRALKRFLNDAQELEQYIWNSYPKTEKDVRVAAQRFFMKKRGMSVIKSNEAVGVFLGPPTGNPDTLDQFGKVAGRGSKTIEFLSNRVADLSLFVVGGMAFEPGMAASSTDDLLALTDDVSKLYADDLVTWVDEGGNLRAGGNPGMRPNAYRYQSGASGARSSVLTGRSQAPYLEFVDSSGTAIGAKFDGVKGIELIDRKLNPFFSSKAVDQAMRQAAVARHYGLTAVWELPTTEAVAAANRFMQANNIEGIVVRLAK